MKYAGNSQYFTLIAEEIGPPLTKKLQRRVVSTMLVVSFQISIHIMDSPKLEAYVHCDGGFTDKWKADYLKLLSFIWEAACDISSSLTGAITLVSLTNDG